MPQKVFPVVPCGWYAVALACPSIHCTSHGGGRQLVFVACLHLEITGGLDINSSPQGVRIFALTRFSEQKMRLEALYIRQCDRAVEVAAAVLIES